MNEIVWLSHGGPGSGRYPKGSGENPRSEIRKKNKIMEKRIRNANKTYDAVNDIINSMNLDDKYKVLAGDSEYLKREQGASVIKRILIKKGNTPVSFFDMLDDGNTINVALGTRSGNKYRGKGYASTAAKKGLKFVDKNKNRRILRNKNKIVWGVRSDNTASIRIAKKNGFVLEKNSANKDKNGYEWVNYVKKLK